MGDHGIPTDDRGIAMVDHDAHGIPMIPWLTMTFPWVAMALLRMTICSHGRPWHSHG